MQKVKKYVSVTLLLLTLPIAAFIATNFVLESSKEIYNFIPEESDIVIEVNTRNFLKEIAYQRIFQEDYFNEKIVPEEGEQQEVPDFGFDFFSSIIIFREQWAEENIWMAVLGYTDQAKFDTYLKEQSPDINLEFGSEYVLIQLSPSSQQESVDEHMKKIMNSEIKSFKERVDLSELFDQSKEINCYIMPQNDNTRNQLISGNLSFDFLQDQIKIDGEFIPVSGFSENAPIAYEIDKDAAFSMRSSLNLMHSIYWFNKEIVEGIPQYSQLAFDYHAMKMFMVHKKLGYPFAMKFFPEMQVRFDMLDKKKWNEFFDTLKSENAIKMDTVAHTFVENKIGFFFLYHLDDKSFELMRDTINLVESTDDKLYFCLNMNVAEMFDNITFAVDEQNPPSAFEQSLGLIFAEGLVEEMKVISNVENIHFDLTLDDETTMIANGKIQMINRNGNSMIESMSFGSAAVLFITSYLSGGFE